MPLVDDMGILSGMSASGLAPDDQHAWDLLVGLIEEELTAQVAIRRHENPDGMHQTASLIADMVWRAFDLEPKPRYRQSPD